MRKVPFLLIVFLAISFTTKAQAYFDIKFPGDKYEKKCRECAEVLRRKPKEVQYGIQRDEENQLYFVVTNMAWFTQLIEDNEDGIAVAVVTKDRYDCSKKKLEKHGPIKGEVLQPVYKKELMLNLQETVGGGAIIKLGEVPEKYREKEAEFNLIILKNKYLCHYNTFYDLKSYRWDLLDMGFFFDSLTLSSKMDTALKTSDKFVVQQKTLKFEIPFEKNKSVYSVGDIKPLYDSLKLTDFDIIKINIRAHSSVEGNEERNVQLQQERAQSIVNALQSFQNPTISTEIIANENWVDFLNDIALTPFASFASLSKTEIKEKLNDKSINTQLEPYLKKHRKAIIVLELQKRNKYRTMQVSELVKTFSEAIAESNLQNAIEIQNTIFERVKEKEIPASSIGKLEIPQKITYSILLNKNVMFKYLMNYADVKQTYADLLELSKVMPKDKGLKYNLCTIKFKLWLLGRLEVDALAFKKELNDLRLVGIGEHLVQRMLINYEIIMCEQYMYKGDYANKDKSLKYIYYNYKNLSLSDNDCLSLAQYFVSYVKIDWAIKLLETKVKTIDINEDLLFYYLNLTIVDDKLTKRYDYRTVMLNAYNLNRSRFCALFNTYGKGGVTFQLLENEYLRKTYCETCTK